MRTPGLRTLMLAAITAVAAIAAHAQGGPMLTDCKPSQLTLAVDPSHDADFNGMSHAGTTLVLTNTSDRACTLMPFVPMTLFGDHGKLDAIGKPPGAKFMHPGPVMTPSVLHPGARATASIRWVSDEVFQNNFCIDPTRITATIDGKELSTAFDAHMCGEASQPVLYELSRFTAQ